MNFTTIYDNIILFRFSSTINEKNIYVNLSEITSMEIIKHKCPEKNVTLKIICKNGKDIDIIYKNEEEIYQEINKAFPKKSKK